MKKQYIIGGLVALGALALIAYMKKPKKNSDGFFSANGRISKASTMGTCAYCRTSSGDVYHTGGDRNCSKGDTCINRYAFNSSI